VEVVVISGHGNIDMAVKATVEQLQKVLAIRHKVPALTHLVVMDAAPGTLGAGETWAELMEAPPEPHFREAALDVRPDELATLIYTSGTTGQPKGAMLTHANLAYMVAATRQHGSVPAAAGEVALSILPLSHVLERAASLYFWDTGVVLAYAESMDTVAENLLEVRPHVMVSVPRLFEKIHQKVVAGGGARGRIARWAADVGARVVDRRLAGKRVPPGEALQFRVADRLVFTKLRERTGGRLRSFISGGAPLAADVARLFFAAGMPIHEGYGLTETSPVLAVNQPGAVRLGTVGRPYPGIRLRIGPENEIQARTPGLMRGYWKNPDATDRAIDRDGWFHTGDIGELDEDGFLRITDRLKDVVVTAGGKNIAPQPIELHATRSPFVNQAVVIADRRPFPILLVVPDWERVEDRAAADGVPLRDREAAATDPWVVRLLEQQTLGRMDRFARHETPKRIAVLADELTVEEGLLTPTLKVRRRRVEERFADLIVSVYERASAERTAAVR
ncbi:MAG: AMP-binding protein, partial [Gemmatimonadota bacterium]